MSYPREEVAAAVERYHEMRRQIDAGEQPGFGVLADFYTEDAVYIDGAWGRIEGREKIARWLDESMVGLGDWKFPIEFTAIEGNEVVVKWTQIIPGARPDGSPFTQSAYSRLSTPVMAASATRRTSTTWSTSSRTSKRAVGSRPSR